MFINACFACTRQGEFYSDSRGQALSIDFLHDYIRINYRQLYARTLAAGINHFNQARIVAGLLATGRETPAGFREEEGELIRATLSQLPPQRVLRLFQQLARRRVNNRRTRSVIRDYLASRRDRAFDAVKYRNKIRNAVAHAHLRLPGELGAFLFDWRRAKFETPLFESFRQAHYSQEAIYELPFTVAEGLAAKHGVPRERFLQRIEPRLTSAERLRLQGAAARAKGVDLGIDLGRTGLTKLALYVLSLPGAERERRRAELLGALEQSARRCVRRAPVKLGRVACVLDRSYSTSGSLEKRRRPLAVALAASFLVRAIAQEHRDFWTEPCDDALFVDARGQTRLAEPVIDALGWGAQLVVIVSDGFENDPPGAVDRVVRAYRSRIDPSGAVSIVHVNPVFDATHFAPRTLGPSIPTVGVRDAEDLPTMLTFARFVDGTAGLEELEQYLSRRVQAWVTTERAR